MGTECKASEAEGRHAPRCGLRSAVGDRRPAPAIPLSQPHAWWLGRLAAAERDEGWLVACERAGLYLAPCRELVAALAALLGRLARGGVVLEVCAGRGELAAALTEAGQGVLATDADPPAGSSVLRMTAGEALRRCRPRVVLGAFVPVDAGVDEAVLSCPSVEHYVLLNARIGGAFGSPALWRRPGWRAEPVAQIARWMITRHDVWLASPATRILTHGEAWLLSHGGGSAAACRDRKSVRASAHRAASGEDAAHLGAAGKPAR